ncbi:MAG: DUF3006 domain-containing protein [Bacillota bacterium]|nr:DUF3006 domain-containing protein [Bacillota bacterium]
MKVILDRFEGNFAVVEIAAGKTLNMPIELIPHGAKERDTIEITINKTDTKKRREKINKLMSELWED